MNYLKACAFGTLILIGFFTFGTGYALLLMWQPVIFSVILFIGLSMILGKAIKDDNESNT
jgi:hypothetical protein